MGLFRNLFGMGSKSDEDEGPKNLYMGNTRLDIIAVYFQLFDKSQLETMDKDTMFSFVEQLIPDFKKCRVRHTYISYAEDHEQAVENAARLKAELVAKKGSTIFGEMGFNHHGTGVVFALTLVVYDGSKDMFTIMQRPAQWAQHLKVK